MKSRVCKCCAGTGLDPDPEAMLKLREGLGLSQNTVASRMGISKQFLCDLEHARRQWDTELIEKFRKALRT